MITTSYGLVDPAHCHPYLREEIALLGDDDPFVSQREFVDRLRRKLADLPQAALDHRPAPGEWSTREVLAHLVQTEIVYGYRYRAIAAEPQTGLAGYDQDRWVQALPESAWPVPVLLAHLAALKAVNVSVLEQLPEASRQLWGLHSERGRESLGALIGALAGHDRMHEAQIEANLAAWRASDGAEPVA